MELFSAQSGCRQWREWANASRFTVRHNSSLRSAAPRDRAAVRRAERELAGCRAEMEGSWLAADVALYAEARRIFEEQISALRAEGGARRLRRMWGL